MDRTQRQAHIDDIRQKFDEGLAHTVAWFSEPANLQRYKVDIYNV